MMNQAPNLHFARQLLISKMSKDELYCCPRTCLCALFMPNTRDYSSIPGNSTGGGRGGGEGRGPEKSNSQLTLPSGTKSNRTCQRIRQSLCDEQATQTHNLNFQSTYLYGKQEIG